MGTARIIHILRSGKALCGRPGEPITWQWNEAWVGPLDAYLANCPTCIEATGRSKAALKKQCKV